MSASPPPFYPLQSLQDERNEISEVLPGKLFLTGWRGATQTDRLVELGISGVVKCEVQFDSDDDEALAAVDSPFLYLRVAVTDDEDQAGAMGEHLDQACRFMKEQKGAVLVHCAAGISRSTTVVLAYLISSAGPEGGMRLLDAFSLVRRARPCVWPNTGFMAMLCAKEASLISKRGGSAGSAGSSTISIKDYQAWSEWDEDAYDAAKVVDRPTV